jgi:hypothetical protein
MSRYGERTRIGEAVSALGRNLLLVLVSHRFPPSSHSLSTGANNYTVPAGVTYIVANIQAAGAGAGGGGTLPSNGGDSSVAFTAGTKTATGGKSGGSSSTTWSNTTSSISGGVVSTPYTPQEFGGGGFFIGYSGAQPVTYQGGFGAFIRTGGVVAPADTLVVTVGAGGAAGSYGVAGQQGIVTLELYEGNTRRVDTFQAGGTFTPPAGVTQVEAWIVGGGGGVGGIDALGTAGGNSSVAFASGTITSNGGATIMGARLGYDVINHKIAGAPNSGFGSYSVIASTNSPSGGARYEAGNGQRRLVSAAVTPLTGITVTIGAGGNNEGPTTGGSGVVWFEYTV